MVTNQQPLEQVETEYSKLLEKSELGKPYMQDGVDLSLLTLGEWKLLGRLNQVHERRIMTRAEELRFFPELGLSEKETVATVRCMTHEELKPLRTSEVIYQKAERMMKELPFEEKLDV